MWCDQTSLVLVRMAYKCQAYPAPEQASVLNCRSTTPARHRLRPRRQTDPGIVIHRPGETGPTSCAGQPGDAATAGRREGAVRPPHAAGSDTVQQAEPRLAGLAG